MKRVKIWIVQTACNFGLYLLSLGPKDAEDIERGKRLIHYWRLAEDQKL